MYGTGLAPWEYWVGALVVVVVVAGLLVGVGRVVDWVGRWDVFWWLLPAGWVGLVVVMFVVAG